MRLIEKHELTGLNINVQEYLLRWKSVAYVTALTCILAVCAAVHMQYMRGFSGELLPRVFVLALAYAAAAVAQLLYLFLIQKSKQALTSIFLSLFCLLGVLKIGKTPFVSGIPYALFFGLMAGFATVALLHEIETLRKYRNRENLAPITFAVGLSLSLAFGTMALQEKLAENDITSYLITILAVFALGIHLKFKDNPTLPLSSGEHFLISDFYSLFRPSELRNRMENGLMFISSATFGAVWTFTFQEEVPLRYIFALLPFLLCLLPLPNIPERMLRLLAAGSLLSLLGGAFLLEKLYFSGALFAFFTGIALSVRSIECSMLSKHSSLQKIAILSMMSMSMLVGILAAGISLSL